MTLQTSGAISFSQINTEMNYASDSPMELDYMAPRKLAGKPSGAISFSDFYGKSGLPLLQGYTVSAAAIGFTSISATTPAGAVGDLLIIAFSGTNCNGIATPSGWTLVHTGLTGTNARLIAFKKIATTASAESVTIAKTGTATPNTSGVLIFRIKAGSHDGSLICNSNTTLDPPVASASAANSGFVISSALRSTTQAGVTQATGGDMTLLYKSSTASASSAPVCVCGTCTMESSAMDPKAFSIGGTATILGSYTLCVPGLRI